MWWEATWWWYNIAHTLICIKLSIFSSVIFTKWKWRVLISIIVTVRALLTETLISRQLYARTCTNTKLCFSQLPYKLFIFILPLAASSCYRHLFCVPMVSANENFHCTGSSERVNFWMRQTRKFYSPWWATSGELILSSKTLAHTSSGIASPLSKISCAFPPSSVCSSIPWFIISEPVWKKKDLVHTWIWMLTWWLSSWRTSGYLIKQNTWTKINF